MTPEIALLLAILAVAVVLFSIEWVPPDAVALGVMLSLILTGLLPAQRAFAGFGSDTVMMLLGLLILTAALLRTGVVEMAGRSILRVAGTNPDRLLALVMISVAGLSAFISNTAATAFFLPIVIGVAARARVSPSRLLLPLAFASILSSSVTLVSTSTNLVVSGLMTEYEMAPMGMFELAPVGVPIALVGLLYMLTVGRRLVSERGDDGGLSSEFGLRPYLTEMVVLPGSRLVGRTLAESGFGRDLDLTVLRVKREGERRVAPRAETRLAAGDVLLVEGRREAVLDAKRTGGIEIGSEAELSDRDLQAEEGQLVEAFLLPGSPLIGRRLKGYGFRERHGLQVLAIQHHEETLLSRLADVRLRLGDVLLVQGPRAAIAQLDADRTIRVVGAVEERRPNVRRAPVAVAIFVGALAAATFDLMALPVAVLLGALLAFLTRCITPEEAYREVEWKAIVLVGSMLALGAAMEETGAAAFMAARVVEWTGGTEPVWLLSGFFALTVLLTQPMSNQAAAVVVLPVAIQTAVHAGLNPRSFAMMVAVAASSSYLTPLEPSCLMVYGPGRYRFVDFVKTGAPLTLLIYLVAVLLVPRVWPL